MLSGSILAAHSTLMVQPPVSMQMAVVVVEAVAVGEVAAVAHASSVGRRVTGPGTALTQAQAVAEGAGVAEGAVVAEEGVEVEAMGAKAPPGMEAGLVAGVGMEEGEGEGLPALGPAITVANQATGALLVLTSNTADKYNGLVFLHSGLSRNADFTYHGFQYIL